MGKEPDLGRRGKIKESAFLPYIACKPSPPITGCRSRLTTWVALASLVLFLLSATPHPHEHESGTTDADCTICHVAKQQCAGVSPGSNGSSVTLVTARIIDIAAARPAIKPSPFILLPPHRGPPGHLFS
jgi:hypothetical protein